MLVIIGTILSAAMSTILIWFYGVMSQPWTSTTSTRFTGTSGDAALTYAILGLVLTFGLVVMGAGLWQIRFGRRNLRLMMLALYALLLVEVIYITYWWLAG